jgi:NAD(P)-dependent dehydrogenase (short-subunit alcohol dehydrogenase family)
LTKDIAVDIRNRVFIVTGGASGLGEGTARMLAGKGAQVLIADLQDRGEEVARDIGGRFMRCDVTSEGDGQAAVASALSMGRLGGLVNCAGIAPAEKTVGRHGPHALALFAKVVTVNLVGTFNMIRLVADALSRNEPEVTGERGVLVCTASVAAFDGQIGQAAYAASKAGVAGMTVTAARDLAQVGIRVMTIAPGIVDTPMMAGFTDEIRAGLSANVPFPKRLAEPAEFARLVTMVVEHDYLNGETIRMDGALRMLPR